MTTFATPQLTFTDQVIGTTSAAQSVTVTNDSAGPLTLAAPDFAFTPNEVPVASTDFSVSVAFTPSAAGDRSTQVTADDATLELIATGVQAFTPSSLDFATPQVIGTDSAPQNVQVLNTGPSSITLSATGFLFSPSVIPVSSAAVTVSVTFRPPATGSFAAANLFPIGSSSLALTGASGVNGFTPASLSFGDILVGQTSASQTLDVYNTSGAPLSLVVVGYTFAPALAPDGQTTAVTVTFSPTSVMSYADSSIQVSSLSQLSLSGNGVLPDFTESNTGTGTDVWARIYVPAPASYIRLGDTPSSDASINETALRSKLVLNGWITSWPHVASSGTVELDPALPTAANPGDFDGAFSYTDHNVVRATHGASNDTFDFSGKDYLRHVTRDAFSLAGANSFYRAKARRRVSLGTTPSTLISDHRALDDYQPSPENTVTLPSFLTGTAFTSGAQSLTLSYADETHVKGNKRTKVYDLLVEEIRGDRATYVKDHYYEFVKGQHRRVVDGTDDKEEYGDKTSVVNGNVTSTVLGPHTGTTTVHGANTSIVKGVGAEGHRLTITGGSDISLYFGFRLGLTVGVRVLLHVGFYLRMIQCRMSWFGFKGDWVHLKYDGGKWKFEDWGVKNKVNAGMCLTYATCGLAWAAIKIGGGQLAITKADAHLLP